jgi:hypothetical protein
MSYGKYDLEVIKFKLMLIKINKLKILLNNP